MKTKPMKLKLIVAALAFAATGSAQAITAADDVSTGNAYLLLTALDFDYNGGVGRSYTRSLEVAMNDFGTQNRPSGGFTTVVDSTPGTSRTWAAGPLWSTFTTGMSAAQISGLRWDVTALDSAGTSAADQKRILTTSAANLETMISNPGSSITNSEVNNAVLNQDKYWDNAIAAMGSGTEIVIDDPASNAFAISAAVHNTNFSGNIPDIDTTNGVGSTMGFYYVTRSSSANTAESLAETYGSAFGDSTFTLAQDGTLTFANNVTPIPVPAAVWLLGSGLVGLVGVARRRKLA